MLKISKRLVELQNELIKCLGKPVGIGVISAFARLVEAIQEQAEGE